MDTENLAAQYGKLDDEKMVTCHPGIIHGSRVSSDSIVMQTINSNAKLSAALMAALPDNILGTYYKLEPKDMDLHLRPEYYDKLLLQNNVELNIQHAITLINIADCGFFSLKFNPTPDIWGSMASTMKSFLFNQCRAISLERTRDTKEADKYQLIVRNNNITQAKTKIGKVLRKLQHSLLIQTIKDSLTKFSTYPEIVNRIRSDPTLLSKASRMKLLLNQSPTQPPKVQTPIALRTTYKLYAMPQTMSPNTTTPERTTYVEAAMMN